MILLRKRAKPLPCRWDLKKRDKKQTFRMKRLLLYIVDQAKDLWTSFSRSRMCRFWGQLASH